MKPLLRTAVSIVLFSACGPVPTPDTMDDSPGFTQPTPVADSPTPMESTSTPVPVTFEPPSPTPTSDPTYAPTARPDTPTPEPLVVTPTPAVSDTTPFVETPTPVSEVPTPSPTPEGPAPIEVALFRSAPDADVPLSRRFTVELERPATLVVFCDEVGGDHERHRIQREGSLQYDITIRGLKPETEYSCWAETDDGTVATSDPISFVTDPLPEDLHGPTTLIRSAPVSEIGYVLYNYAHLTGDWHYESEYLTVADADGNVRWYLPGPGGGSIDASYLGDGRFLYGGFASKEFVPTIVGLDWQNYFVDTSGPQQPHGMVGSYHHDAGLSADGTSIFSMLNTTVKEDYLGFEVVQIDLNSNVLWTWDSEVDGIDKGYLPFDESMSGDPFHANAVWDQWEGGRLYLYVSMRALSRVIKIDYLTKALVWSLSYDGDFTLLEEDGTPAQEYRWFFNQHDAQRHGKYLTLYDNGYTRSSHGSVYDYSRAIELELDEGLMTARIVFEYDELSEDWIEPAWGGLDLLDNGHFLVAMGHCWDCTDYSEHNSALVELDPSGEQVWRTEFSDKEETFYRADHIDGCAIFANTRYCPELNHQM